MRTVVAILRLAAAFIAFQTIRLEQMPIVLGIVMFLVPAALLGALASALEGGRRLWLTGYRDRQAQELLQRLMAGTAGDEPVFLYLRPFSSTGKLTIENPAVVGANAATPGGYANPTLEAESVLRDALDRFGTLIGLGRQGEHYGAGRVTTDDEQWRAMVELLADKATLIFLLPSDHPGTLWEIQLLRERGHLAKTILVMPPASTSRGFSSAAEWERTRTKLAEDGIVLPAHQATGVLFPAVASKKPFALKNWVASKERQLRGGLKRLAAEVGVPLAPRATAGRRIDAPLWPPLVWMMVFSLMIWGGGLSPWSLLDIVWLRAIVIGLGLFLFLEATYGRLSRKALALLAVTALCSASSYAFFPIPPLFDYGPAWLPASFVGKAAVIGLLLGLLLRELTPQRFRLRRVVVLTVISVLSAQIIDYMVRQYVPFQLPGLVSPGDYLTGLFFGLGLPRATGWNPWRNGAESGPALGVEGTFFAWTVVGFAVMQFGSSTPGIWVVLAFAGALAQCYGWYRAGRPISFGRGFLLVTSWTLSATAAVLLASRLGLGTAYDFRDELHALSVRDRVIGFVFGAAAGALTVLVRRDRNRSWARAGVQAFILGVGFGLIGKFGSYFVPPDVYRGNYWPAVPLFFILATLMATAEYLNVERVPPPRRLAEPTAILPREIALKNE